jgi:hypothetical protein
MMHEMIENMFDQPRTDTVAARYDNGPNGNAPCTDLLSRYDKNILPSEKTVKH